MRLTRPSRRRARSRASFAVVVALALGDAVPAATQEGAISPVWSLDLTAGVGYDDNLRFTPAMESAPSGRLRAGLSRLMRSPRANATFGVSADGMAYRHAPEFRRLNYGAGLAGAYLVSPRTAVRVAESFSRAFTGESPLLIEAGLLFPRTVTRTNEAMVEASHQMSPRWNGTLSARHRFIAFDSPLLVDGATLSARAEVSWAASPASRVGLSYEVGRMNPRGRAGFDTHHATLRGERRVTDTSTVRLELGADRLTSPAPKSGRVAATGAAGFAVRSPKQTLEVSAVRTVSEAFGLGRLQLRSAANLRWARTLTTRLALGLSGSLSRSENPNAVGSQEFFAGILTGEFKLRLAKDAEFAVAGGYRRLDPAGAASTHSRFATLALKVGQAW